MGEDSREVIREDPKPSDALQAYVNGACESLISGGLSKFKSFYYDHKRFLPASIAFRKIARSNEGKCPEIEAFDSTGPRAMAGKSREFDTWNAAWDRIVAIWRDIQLLDSQMALVELESLEASPWRELSTLAFRCRIVLLNRYWIMANWPKPHRQDLLRCFFAVILQPVRLTQNQRQILQYEFGVNGEWDSTLGPFCRLLAQTHEQLGLVAGDALGSLLAVDRRVNRVAYQRSMLLWILLWGIAALLVAFVLRSVLLAIAEPRREKRSGTSKPLVTSPSRGSDADQSTASIQSIRTRPHVFHHTMESDFQAFSLASDQHDYGVTLDDMSVGALTLYAMQRKHPALIELYQQERRIRLSHPHRPTLRVDGSPAPATIDELRKLHLLNLLTDRERTAGEPASPSEHALKEYLQELGDRRPIVLRDYRVGLRERPSLFPGVQGLSHEIVVPVLTNPSTKPGANR